MREDKEAMNGIDHVEDLDKIGHLANQEEHEQTKWQAVKNSPKAVFWCVYAIWVLVLNSFENQAGGIVLGIPEFRKDFGTPFAGGYVLDAKWQSAFSGGPVAT